MIDIDTTHIYDGLKRLQRRMKMWGWEDYDEDDIEMALNRYIYESSIPYIVKHEVNICRKYGGFIIKVKFTYNGRMVLIMHHVLENK